MSFLCVLVVLSLVIKAKETIGAGDPKLFKSHIERLSNTRFIICFVEKYRVVTKTTAYLFWLSAFAFSSNSEAAYIDHTKSC
jgi:hypothetical protein